MKKKISEEINKTIPIFSLMVTFFEWLPWKVLSREISRHHMEEVRRIEIVANNMRMWVDV